MGTNFSLPSTSTCLVGSISIGIAYVCIRSVEFFFRYRHTLCWGGHASILVVLGGESEREYAGIELIRCGLEGYEEKRIKVKDTKQFQFQNDPSTNAVRNHPPTFLIVSSGHFNEDHPAFDALRQQQYGSGMDLSSPCFVVDRHAIDTVTNFTTIASSLAVGGSCQSNKWTRWINNNDPDITIPTHLRHVRHIYVLSTAYHMPRALAIGRIVLSCGYGIGIIPCSIVDPNTPTPSSSSSEPSNSPNASLLTRESVPTSSLSRAAQSESFLRTARDVLRSLLWLYFGCDGTSISRIVHPERWKRTVR